MHRKGGRREGFEHVSVLQCHIERRGVAANRMVRSSGSITRALMQVAMPAGILIGALGGCGASTALNTGHEAAGTLTGRSTYAFVAPKKLEEKGFTTGHLFNPIMQRRIRDELGRELARRGYTPSTAESASMLVTFSAGSRQDVITQGNQEGSVVRGPAYTVDRGALVLHFLDPQTNRVIWRGWAATRKCEAHTSAGTRASSTSMPRN